MKAIKSAKVIKTATVDQAAQARQVLKAEGGEHATLSPIRLRHHVLGAVLARSPSSASFARDLRVLLDASWTLRSLRGFDLFPMTEHVELVGILEAPG